MSFEDDELVLAFVSESQDMLDDVEPKLIELQQMGDGADAMDEEKLNAVFRLFHSIKGSAGFLQMKYIAAVTHEAETLLDLFRKGNAQITVDNAALLFQTCDLIRKLLIQIENHLNDEGYEQESATLVALLSQAIAGTKNENKEANSSPDTAPKKINIEASPMTEPSSSTPTTNAETKTSNFVVTSDMTKLFIQDAEELLDTIEQSLVHIQDSLEDPKPIIQEALRALHTFKGNCGFLSLADIEKLCHKTETILTKALETSFELEAFHLKTLLKIIDIVRKTVNDLDAEGKGKVMGLTGLLDLMNEICPETIATKTEIVASSNEKIIEGKPPSLELDNTVSNSSEKQLKPATPSTSSNQKTTPSKSAPPSRRDIRVSVEKLELLGNLVGELVIAEAVVTHNSDLQNLRLDNFERAAHDLDRITNDLQDITMSPTYGSRGKHLSTYDSSGS